LPAGAMSQAGYAVGIDEIVGNERADYAHALVDVIHRNPVQFEPNSATTITTQDETACFAQQRSGLVEVLASGDHGCIIRRRTSSLATVYRLDRINARSIPAYS
jgi:hypothetical protein